jgi:hypothetical protein
MSDVVFISGGNAAVFDGQPAPQGAKGDPGSPGEGYATRALMAARAAPALLDDVYLNESGRSGKFIVKAASAWTAAIAADTAQGIFVPSTADATKVYVREFFDRVLPAWWGAVGDFNGTSGTDNAAAFTAMFATLKALAGNTYNVLNPRGPRIAEPVGLSYYFGSTISLKQAIDFQGVGSGLPDGKGTRFVFPANTHGFIFNRWTTNGETGSVTGTTGADTSIIRGLRAEAVKTGATAGNTATGFYCRAPVTFENCQALFFAQDGFCFHSDESGTFLGNANGAVIRDCYAEGNNANAILFENCIDFSNGGYGKRLTSAAGNTLIGGQGAGNGVLTAGLFPTTSMVNDGAGNLYAVMPGQAVAASTTTPGTNAAVWTLVETGAGTDFTSIPQWFSGVATCEGGAGYIGVGLALDPYAEARQGPYYIGTSARVIGGSHGYTPIGPGLYDRFSFGAGAYILSSGLQANGAITTQGAVAGLFINSRDTGAAYQLYNTAGILGFHNGSQRWQIDPSGNVTLLTGVMKIGANQVVGARQTGWAADTGTAKKTTTATYTGGTAAASYTQSEITALKNSLQDSSQTIKALKDALIAHGLIGA